MHSIETYKAIVIFFGSRVRVDVGGTRGSEVHVKVFTIVLCAGECRAEEVRAVYMHHSSVSCPEPKSTRERVAGGRGQKIKFTSTTSTTASTSIVPSRRKDLFQVPLLHSSVQQTLQSHSLQIHTISRHSTFYPSKRYRF
jgi:hypothetical protein